jgi:hypothetical protein
VDSVTEGAPEGLSAVGVVTSEDGVPLGEAVGAIDGRAGASR